MRMIEMNHFVPEDNRELFVERIRPYLDKVLSNIGYTPTEFTYEATSSTEYIERCAKLLNMDNASVNHYDLQAAINAASEPYRKAYVDGPNHRIIIFANRLIPYAYYDDACFDKGIESYLNDIIPEITEISGKMCSEDTLVNWLHNGCIYGSPGGLYSWISENADMVREIVDRINYFSIPFFVINRKELSIHEARDAILEDGNLNWYDLGCTLCRFYLEDDGLLIDRVAIDEYDDLDCIFVEPNNDNLDPLYRLMDTDTGLDFVKRFNELSSHRSINLEKLNEFLKEQEDDGNNSGKDENTND